MTAYAASDAQKLRDELHEHAKVTPFAFKRRDNQIARHGIENNYDESVLKPYVINKTDSADQLLGRNSTTAGRPSSPITFDITERTTTSFTLGNFTKS